MSEVERRSAAELLAELLVPDTWESWDDPVGDRDVDAAYGSSLARASERSGADESVLTGCGSVGGARVAIVISEFGFLGGSIGAVAGQRVTAAVRRATAERLPVLAMPASGGTRMQEGTAAFLQMVAITGAVVDHRRAGLLYLVYLRHPTTGGVFASWGSLGHLTWAEPGALIGFLGPRVYQGLYGRPFPADVQIAENLREHGLVDDVLTVAEVGELVGRTVSVVDGHRPVPTREDVEQTVGDVPTPDTWRDVGATRAADRPGLSDLLDADRTVVIRSREPIWLVLTDFGGTPVVCVGHDRRAQARGDLIGPVDLRLARRGIALAGELGLPLVTVIDTPGADLSVDAENGGLATEIAQCTAEMVGVDSPTLSVLLGQGAGGAALALFPTDRRVAISDSWLSPLPPEGASIIVHRDLDHAAELTEKQGISVRDLAASGIVDDVVEARGDWIATLRSVIVRELADIGEPSTAARTRVPGG